LCHYSWYKRSETGTKVAIFFSSATVAGAFSKLLPEIISMNLMYHEDSGGLLAAAIADMDGAGGKPGILRSPGP